MVRLTVAPHPLLSIASFLASFPRPLGELPSPAWLTDLLRAGAPAPLARDESVRQAVRELLRHGGYKPTGRGKPASEYLLRAAGEGVLGSINLAVDALNAVSLHSGLPISAIDLDRAAAPLSIRIAAPGSSYAFNASGQTIDLEGLPCLCDAGGPCANAVKDAQRTKTAADTRRALCVIWSARGLEARLEAAAAWHRSLLEQAGASTAAVEAVPA